MASTAAVHFAHLSRRFTIRTVSQMQKAATAIPNTDSRISMPAFYPARPTPRKHRSPPAPRRVMITGMDDKSHSPGIALFFTVAILAFVLIGDLVCAVGFL